MPQQHLYNEQVSILRHVSSRLAPLAHPVTNFRALRQDLRRQRVEGRALIDPHNTYRPSVRAELRRMFTRPLPVETQTLICNALLAAIAGICSRKPGVRGCLASLRARLVLRW